MIEYWAPKGHVIWENVLVSANIGRWAVLSKKLEPINHNVWVFLDTPLQVCIDRVLERRAKASEDGFNHRQSDDEVDLNVIAGHWRRVRRATARAYKEGIDVRILKNEVAYEQVHNLLVREGNWNPNTDGFVQEYEVSYPERWTPSEDELELVLKTARFPWEPEDTVTKVDFISKKQRPRGPITIFGTTVKRWGGGDAYEDTGIKSVFGAEIKKWPVADTITGVRTEPDFFINDEPVTTPSIFEEQES